MSSPFDLPLGARPGKDTPVGQDELGRTVYRTIRGTQYTIPEPVTMPAPSFGERAGMVGQAARGATLGGIFDVAKGLGRGVLEGIVQGVTAPRRALQGEPQTYGDVAATAGLGIFGAAPFQTGSSTLRSGIGRSGDPEAGIRAYHGSPHDFDRFSSEFIGTGEGAQAYGRGLYFGQDERVARRFRDQISGADTAAARRTLQSFDGDVDRAISDTRAKLNRLEQRAAAGDFGGDERRFNAQSQIQRNKLDQLERFKETGEFSPGRMYEVDIAARPEDFLDWETPLSAQPEMARRLGARTRSEREINDEAYALFDQYGTIDQWPPEARARLDALYNEMDLPGTTQTGGEIYEFGLGNRENVQDVLAGPSAQRSQELLDRGIQGVRYQDPVTGTPNLVVFDENLISIVRKYGIAGAATMLGVTAADVQQALADNLPQSEWESLVVGP